MAAQGSRKKDLVVRPGYGADELHLRQTEQQVRKFLGKPESVIRRFKGQYFLNYFKKGVQVDIGKTGGRVRYIYFYREGVMDYSGARVLTLDGLTVADSRSRVLRRRGKPDKSGKPFVLNWGEYVGEWCYYQDGINFTFGRDHRVDMISILPRKNLKPIPGGNRGDLHRTRRVEQRGAGCRSLRF